MKLIFDNFTIAYIVLRRYDGCDMIFMRLSFVVIKLLTAASVMLLFCLLFSHSVSAQSSEKKLLNDTATFQTEEAIAIEDATVQTFDSVAENVDNEAVDVGLEISTMAASMSSNDGVVRKTINSKFYAETDPVTGALLYRYPIFLPPGRNGIGPNLNLVYSSQSNDSLNNVGYGWDFDIPSITRINKTGTNNLYQQNYYHSSLDGELVSVGTSSNQYVPKVEYGSFNKYLFDPITGGWIVKMKDGSVLSLGSTQNARIENTASSSQIYKWFLGEQRDTNGNYITYSYYKNNEFVYPSQITYTNHTSVPGQFVVTFTRENRSDVISSNAAGFTVQVIERIAGINVIQGSSTLLTYSFGYGVGDNNVRSVLGSVSVSGVGMDEVVTTLPATQFAYKKSQKNWTEATEITIPVLFDKSTYLVDVNGDALVDIIKSTHNSNQVYLNQKTGWATSSAWVVPLYFVDSSAKDLGVRVVDVNGDGLNDFIKSHSSGTATYLNNGTAWATSSLWSLPVLISDSSNNDLGVRFVDITGDGLVDVVRRKDSVSSVHINTGTGWATSTSWVVPAAFVNGSIVDNRVQIIDVNGDGLSDFIYSSAVYINNGSNWVLDTGWSLPPSVNQAIADSRTRFTDMNGDGLIDILNAHNDLLNSTSTAHINTGSGWQFDAVWSSPAVFSTNTGGPAGVVDNCVVVVDVNGDGLMDMAQTYDASTKRVWLNNNRPVDFLEKIVHPEGGSTHFSYKVAQEYQTGTTSLNTKIPYPINTVSAIGTDNGQGLTSTTTYLYSDGLYYYQNPWNKQFAGFKQVTVNDALGAITKNYYHQGDTSSTSDGEFADSQAKIGQVYRTEVFNAGNQLLKKSVAKWDQFVNGSINTFVKLSQQVLMDYEGDSSHRDSARSFLYDNSNGNQVGQMEWGEVVAQNDGTFTDIGLDRVMSTTTYASSTDSDYIIMPSSVITADSNNQTVAETKWYYDDLSLHQVDRGNMTRKEDRISTSSLASTTITYNTFGLPIEVKDARGNATTYEYDAALLYVGTTTNPLGHKTATEYNYTFGTIATTTTPNGSRYATIYDGVGRVVKQFVPSTTSVSADLVLQKKYQYYDVERPYVKTTAYLNPSLSHDSYVYYDALGRVVQERNRAEGSDEYVVKTYVYRNSGLLQKESLPYFSKGPNKTTVNVPKRLFINYNHDVLGRITALGNIVGTTTTSYTDWSQTKTDANDHIKSFIYDARGNLVKVSENNGADTYITNYAYNHLGNLTKITDAEGNIRSFSYDLLGRRVRAEDLHASADGTFGVRSYVYDVAGNLVQLVNPALETIEYTYDDLNRVLTEDELSSEGNEKTFVYDTCSLGVGFMCSAANRSATSTYGYMPHGLIKDETRIIDGVSYITTNHYDWSGNRIGVVYPNVTEVYYEYNPAGLLESILMKKFGATTTETVVEDFDYAPTGLVSYQKNGNGTETFNEYDDYELYRLRHKKTIGPGLGIDVLPDMDSMARTMVDEQASVMEMSFSDASVKNPIEVEYLRTAESTTRHLGKDRKGNAIFVTNIYPQTIHGVDNSGNFTTEDTLSVVQTNTKGTLIKSRHYESVVPALSALNLFTYDAFGSTIAVSASDSKFKGVTPQLLKKGRDESIIQYQDVFGPGVGLEVLFADTHIQKDIIFSSIPEFTDKSTTYNVTFKLSSAIALDIEVEGKKLEAGRDIVSQNEAKVIAEDGEVVAVIRAPRAVGGMTNLDPSNTIAISMRYELRKDGIYVTKIIPRDWLEKAVYPVRADFVLGVPTTVADGYIQSQPYPSSWATQQSNTIGSTPDYTSHDIIVDSQAYTGTTWLAILRGFLPFDTSALPDEAVVTAANLNLYIKQKWDQYNDSYGTINVYQSRQASQSALVSSDFGLCGNTTTNPTGGSTAVDITSITTSAYLSMPLNVTGRSWVSPTSTTKLCIREGHDAANQSITSNGVWKYSGVVIASSESTGTSTDPYLEITYSIPNIDPATSTDLRVEGMQNPDGITKSYPRFSAIFNDGNAFDVATHYQVQVSTSSGFLSMVWDSTKTAFSVPVSVGAISGDIYYDGVPLPLNGTQYHWRIRMWDDAGVASPWSSGNEVFTMINDGSLLQDLTYEYDAVGNITSIVDTANGGSPMFYQYSYDDIDRLTVAIATSTIVGPDVPKYKLPITINASTTLNGLTNFPVHINLADLPNTFWDKVRPDGGDIRVTDSDGVSASVDVVSINKTVKAGELYFKAPSFSIGTSTRFWLYYGAPTLVAALPSDPYGSQNVWSSERAVWQFEGLSTSTSKRSSRASSSLTLTAYNTPTSTPDMLGRSDGAYALNGTNQYTDIAYTSQLNLGSQFTLSAVVMPTLGSASTDRTVVSRRNGSVEPFGMSLENGGYPFVRVENQYLSNQNTSYATAVYKSTDIDDGQWHQIDFTYDNVVMRLYVDGVLTAVKNANNLSGNSAQGMSIGRRRASTNYFSGKIASVYMSPNVATSSAIRASYLNRFNPADFYTIGSSSLSNLNAPTSSVAYTELYTYSPIGNITSMSRDGIATAYAYAQSGFVNPHAPTTIGSTTLTYDNNGNLHTAASSTYLYSYDNRLSALHNGFSTTTYAYDHTGSRIQKVTPTHTTTYVSPAYEVTGTTTTLHLYAGDTLITSLHTAAGTTTDTYVHPDHLGSTNVTTNQDGVLTNYYTYTPYGSHNIATTTASSTYTEPNQFIGQDYDPESTLSYLNARYYDSERGQFISQDPMHWAMPAKLIIDPQIQNSYGYARNNPVIYKDASGEIPIVAALLVGAAVSGVAGQLTEDMVSGQLSGWQSYAGAAAAGMTGMGVALTVTRNPAAIGAVTSGSEELYTRMLLEGNIDSAGLLEIRKQAIQGLFFGTIGTPSISGITAGRNSINARAETAVTKAVNGTASNATAKTVTNVTVSQTVGGTSQSLYNGVDSRLTSSQYSSAANNIKKASDAIKKGDYTSAMKYLQKANQNISSASKSK